MVAQVLADAVQLVHRLDAEAAQQLGLADAGMLQHARRLTEPHETMTSRLTRTSRFWPAHRVGDADRALALEDDVAHQRIGLDLEVRPVAGRIEEARAVDWRLPFFIVTW